MTEIKNVDGVIILTASKFDLKIDKSRKIYVKNKDKNTFIYIGHDSPEGMSSDEKKKLLYELYRRIDSKMQQQ